MNFKRAHKHFVLHSSLAGADRGRGEIVKIGDVVKVEADRGEAVGIIIAKTLSRNFKEIKLTAGFRGRGFAPAGIENIRCIISLATVMEKSMLSWKAEEEDEVLQVSNVVLRSSIVNTVI